MQVTQRLFDSARNDCHSAVMQLTCDDASTIVFAIRRALLTIKFWRRPEAQLLAVQKITRDASLEKPLSETGWVGRDYDRYAFLFLMDAPLFVMFHASSGVPVAIVALTDEGRIVWFVSIEPRLRCVTVERATCGKKRSRRILL